MRYIQMIYDGVNLYIIIYCTYNGSNYTNMLYRLNLIKTPKKKKIGFVLKIHLRVTVHIIIICNIFEVFK